MIYYILTQTAKKIKYYLGEFMVYITGDMHGCLERLYDKSFRKLKSGDVLIVCGDFGFIFDGSKTEKQV